MLLFSLFGVCGLRFPAGAFWRSCSLLIFVSSSNEGKSFLMSGCAFFLTSVFVSFFFAADSSPGDFICGRGLVAAVALGWLAGLGFVAGFGSTLGRGLAVGLGGAGFCGRGLTLAAFGARASVVVSVLVCWLRSAKKLGFFGGGFGFSLRFSFFGSSII